MAATATSAASRTDASARARSFPDRLIEAAETLYGRHGLEGVSLRQIGTAAGGSNNYAVQYHFGDVAGLVRAIFAARAPGVLARQQELMERIEAEGALDDTRALIEAFLRPLLEPVNKNGERAYARFSAAMLSSSAGIAYCRELFHLTPGNRNILAHLHEANPQVSPGLLNERMRLVTIMVCTSVFNRTSGAEHADDLMLIEDMLDMAAAAIVVAQRRPLSGPAEPGRVGEPTEAG